ncbi:MAG: hypothetical protein Tp182DCM212571_18 [Prokaryotic dsDNA virus sp.]|jgi:hypothetical protein|nr:MAG: hypothetical protein Tp182DCM212571_18 [Prokaryotic dsDNA virus sp.]
MNAPLPPLTPPRPNAGQGIDWDRPVGYGHAAKNRDSYQPRKTFRIRWAEVAATTAVSALFVAFGITAYNLATDEPQPSCDEAIAAWGTAEETRVHALVTAESYGSLQSLEAQDAWDTYYARVTLADIAHARYILACNASDAEFMDSLDSRVEGR